MLSEKQEKFLRLLLEGKTQREAYRAAYPNSRKWKDSAVDSQASILRNSPKVSQRFQDLKKAAAKRNEVKVDDLLGELKSIGFSNITNIVSWHGNSLVIKDLSRLPPEVTAAIASIKETKYSIEIKLWDKNKALEALGRYLGMFDTKDFPGGFDSEDDGFTVAIKASAVEVWSERHGRKKKTADKTGHPVPKVQP